MMGHILCSQNSALSLTQTMELYPSQSGTPCNEDALHNVDNHLVLSYGLPSPEKSFELMIFCSFEIKLESLQLQRSRKKLCSPSKNCFLFAVSRHFNPSCDGFYFCLLRYRKQPNHSQLSSQIDLHFLLPSGSSADPETARPGQTQPFVVVVLRIPFDWSESFPPSNGTDPSERQEGKCLDSRPPWHGG